jgi:hypothetical protein
MGTWFDLLAHPAQFGRHLRTEFKAPAIHVHARQQRAAENFVASSFVMNLPAVEKKRKLVR